MLSRKKVSSRIDADGSIGHSFPTLQKKLLAQFLEKTRTLRNLRQ